MGGNYNPASKVSTKIYVPQRLFRLILSSDQWIGRVATLEKKLKLMEWLILQPEPISFHLFLHMETGSHES